MAIGKGVKESATARLREKQKDFLTKYSGMEAITESYEEIVNGIRIIRTRTRYRKRKRRK